MRYGSLEYAYAAPFANALIKDTALRAWVIGRTKFASAATDARLLHEEMRAQRSKSAENWWRSHYSEKCRCEDCSGQETDLLAIFEQKNGSRFAIHVEVKQPNDIFPAHKDQATNYRRRATCWSKIVPTNILPHSDADTLLLCSESKLHVYAKHIVKFGGVITFEELRQQCPDLAFPLNRG